MTEVLWKNLIVLTEVIEWKFIFSTEEYKVMLIEKRTPITPTSELDFV